MTLTERRQHAAPIAEPEPEPQAELECVAEMRRAIARNERATERFQCILITVMILTGFVIGKFLAGAA